MPILDCLFVTNNIQSALDDLRTNYPVKRINRCRLQGTLEDGTTFRIVHVDSYTIKGIQIRSWDTLGMCSVNQRQYELLNSRIR